MEKIDRDFRMTELIRIENIVKSFVTQRGDVVTALGGLTMDVSEGEFVSIIGPSGCGKTTLLRIVAGLLRAEEGTVRIRGSVVSGPGPDRAVVFQNFALLPWRTVTENVQFPLEVRKVAKQERQERAREVLESVGLAEFENAYPRTLSGGMQQRVGLARALAVNSDTLLLDEPFGALDAQTKQVLQDDFQEVWQQYRKTVIMVTHDMREAVALSDRVVVLSPRPGVVAKELAVDLSRPRDEDVRRSARFGSLVEEVWSGLRDYARQ